MDDQLRQRLADLSEIATAMDPGAGENEIGRARIEAYREGIRFAVTYLEDLGASGSGDADVIPLPRDK